jgi:hypothetical protein
MRRQQAGGQARLELDVAVHDSPLHRAALDRQQEHGLARHVQPEAGGDPRQPGHVRLRILQ